MLTRFAISADGAIVITVPDGGDEDFEQAREKILRAFEKLGQTCPEIKRASEPEKHSHGPEKSAVRTTTNA